MREGELPLLQQLLIHLGLRNGEAAFRPFPEKD
jgi:hypothetical protein